MLVSGHTRGKYQVVLEFNCRSYGLICHVESQVMLARLTLSEDVGRNATVRVLEPGQSAIRSQARRLATSFPFAAG
jgi:hypothetical protein